MSLNGGCERKEAGASGVSTKVWILLPYHARPGGAAELTKKKWAAPLENYTCK